MPVGDAGATVSAAGCNVQPANLSDRPTVQTMNRQTKESLQTLCRLNSTGHSIARFLLIREPMPACSLPHTHQPACSPMDGCPRLRFVRAQVESLLREFAHAVEPDHRAKVQSAAAALAHVVEQVVMPLFGRLHGPAWRLECQAMFDALCVIVRCDPKLHPANFADDDDRWQIVCDRLDSLEVRIRHLVARRNHKAGQSAETEVA